MIRKITFDLVSPTTGEKLSLLFTFTDEELKQLNLPKWDPQRGRTAHLYSNT